MDASEINRQLANYVHRDARRVNGKIQTTRHPERDGTIERLLAAGADPDHAAEIGSDNKTRTLLGLAVSEEDENAVKALLAAGANPNLAAPGQHAPLWAACGASGAVGKEALDRIGAHLIAAGADIDATPEPGMAAPIEVAFASWNNGLALTLAKAGAIYKPNVDPYRDLLVLAVHRGTEELAVEILAGALLRREPGLDKALESAKSIAENRWPKLAANLEASALARAESRELAESTPAAALSRKRKLKL